MAPAAKDLPSSVLLHEACAKLLAYCRANEWAGWDPYDGLNSPLFKLPLLQNYPCRLAFIQLFKRSPLNLRPLFRVPKEQNPKGLALFTSSLVRLSRARLADIEQAEALARQLLALRSPGWGQHCCWGYNFDWQTRYYLVPRFTPNIICTTFGANALLDLYDATSDESLLRHAQSSGEFLLRHLNRTAGDNGSFCFSYTPLDTSKIHNANLLGAALLARLQSYAPSDELRQTVLQAVGFSITRIREDGSWVYGEGGKQQWVDSFHTGYNLLALEAVRRHTGDGGCEAAVRNGFRYYLDHFFTPEGMVKYYHNRVYPVDAHAVGHALITLSELRSYAAGCPELAQRVLGWALENLRVEEGWFVYQKRAGGFDVRIPYIRWCQAWILLGMASMALAESSVRQPEVQPEARARVEAAGLRAR